MGTIRSNLFLSLMILTGLGIIVVALVIGGVL